VFAICELDDIRGPWIGDGFAGVEVALPSCCDASLLRLRVDSSGVTLQEY
jgi:hypothetical protein